jgi:hypothetical protein
MTQITATAGTMQTTRVMIRLTAGRMRNRRKPSIVI